MALKGSDQTKETNTMERKLAEPTFLDAMVADLGGPRTGEFLARCQELIPWQTLVDSIKHLFPEQPLGGRPFWPAAVMLKCVMLQKWYGLSDPQLEEQLRDRISFRRFVGLGLEEATPDETTLVKFRERLRNHGCASTVFDAALESLRSRGLVLKEGTIVDATIIDAPQGRKVKEADGTERHTHDRCASYTKNHGTLRHGYKAHLATDTRGLITDWVFDTARPHDSNHIEQLTTTEQTVIYADSAYRSKEREQQLSDRRVRGMIVHKRVRGQKQLSPEQKAHNTACSRVRAFVEHPRAWMVKMGYTATRYRGLVRNALDFSLTAVAYNFKRSFSLLDRPLSKPRPQRLDRLSLAARAELCPG
jgi:IS5 family transposase